MIIIMYCSASSILTKIVNSYVTAHMHSLEKHYNILYIKRILRGRIIDENSALLFIEHRDV